MSPARFRCAMLLGHVIVLVLPNKNNNLTNSDARVTTTQFSRRPGEPGEVGEVGVETDPRRRLC
jgi:hypothetical protein